MSILIVSNGHGEDAVGALLAQKVLRSGVDVIAYPLVGDGAAYQSVRLLEPRRALPSGGFAFRAGWAGWKQLWPDLRAGGFRLWFRQRRTLRQQAMQHKLVVAVGDVYCLWMATHAGAPIIFVATAKSEYNERHSAFELSIMRRRADRVFTRDDATAEALAKRGVRVRYEGNPLMDAVPEDGRPLSFPPGAPVIALLPGSRADALRNVVELLKICRRVSIQEAGVFVCAMPSSLRMGEVARIAESAGWEVDGQSLLSGDARVLLTREFGTALRAAAVTVGLAGTANEQAAGLGMPVVTFPVRGAVQVTPRFLQLQKRLLGDALVSAPNWEDAAEEVVQLLRNPDERARRAEVGRQRMGHTGAVESVVREILSSTGNVLSTTSPRARD
jgi:uncharacterized protein (TIGR03492 family)